MSASLKAIQKAATDRAVSDARDLPSLVNNLSAVNPDLAQQFTGKLLLASRSAPGPFVTGALTWLVAHYALGWSPEFTSMVAGGVVLLAGYALRYITSAPISGVVRAQSPAVGGAGQ